MKTPSDGPRGITTFTTRQFKNEGEVAEWVASQPNPEVFTVRELRRLGDGPSDWVVMIPK